MSTLDDLTSARYERMRWNTPLSQTHADLLLQRLGIPAGARVVDLGCGWGELLMQAVSTDDTGSTTGTGVDIDAEALTRGRPLAAGSVGVAGTCGPGLVYRRFSHVRRNIRSSRVARHPRPARRPSAVR